VTMDKKNNKFRDRRVEVSAFNASLTTEMLNAGDRLGIPDGMLGN